jgi:hypothetical protein
MSLTEAKLFRRQNVIVMNKRIQFVGFRSLLEVCKGLLGL